MADPLDANVLRELEELIGEPNPCVKGLKWDSSGFVLEDKRSRKERNHHM